MLTERDLAILEHIRRYQLTTAAAVSRLWLQGKSSEHVLTRLKPHIEFTPFKPGRSGYYTLAAAGAAALKIRLSRPLGPSALHKALAALSFCVMGEHPRERMFPADMERYLGPQPTHSDIHCWQETPGPIIFRILAGQSDEHSLQRLETLDGELRKTQTTAQGLHLKRYGFAILVDRQPRRELIERSIDALKGAHRVHPDSLIVVELVESPTTLMEKEFAREPEHSPAKRPDR